MTTLITGGTGKTGLPLAKLLHNAKRPFLIATRSESGIAPHPFKAVKFDWFDATTHESALTPEVDRVYIVGPPMSTDSSVITSFIDLAVSKGIKRFVLLSATPVEPGSQPNIPSSVVHQHLIDIGVDYTVLRPTWFIQNFATNFGKSIKERDEIFSATQDGRIPLVSTEDIAKAAFDALVAEESPNKDIFVVGPELLSYEDAANIASLVLGRKITFKRHTVEEQAQFYINQSWPVEEAELIANMDTAIADGSEEELFNNLTIAKEGRIFIGTHTVKEYFEENKELWITSKEA